MNAQKLKWDDIRYILAVCREGTLSGAARSLNVNHSTVFRRIGQIEDQIQVRLFDRLTSGYAMTHAGAIVLESATHIDEEINRLSRKLYGGGFQLSGTLRITLPEDVSTSFIVPHIAEFNQKYPDIQTELLPSNEVYNLSQHEADIAIRGTSSPADTLVGHLLCKLDFTAYASKAYLQKNREKTLAEHQWIMYSETFNNCPAVKWQIKQCAKAPVVFRSTSIFSLFEAVKNNMGVAVLPVFLGDNDATLEALIDPPKALQKEFWILTHPDLRRTAKVHAFMEFMKNEFQDLA